MTDYSEHIPLFPPDFGEDKGEFFKHYDKIQDEIDDGMVKRLKENLDGLLVFAGLFAGINSAFLALTLSLMSVQPSDDITSLLQDIVQGIKAVASLPSESFHPSQLSLSINALFALSLSSALFAAFFAVLGKQWLMLYRNRNGGGVDQQRWEQLRRSLGAERWGLVPVLEVALPVLIQIALVIFAIGFTLYLNTMSPGLARFVFIPLIAAFGILVFGVGVSVWDASSPFKTPLSEMAHTIPTAIEAASHIFRRRRQTDLQSKRASEKKAAKKRAKAAEREARKEVARVNRRASDTSRDPPRNPEVDNGSFHRKDEEAGYVQTISSVSHDHGASPPTLNSHESAPAARWKHLFGAIVSGKWRGRLNPKRSFGNIVELVRLLPKGRVAEGEQFLQIASIIRVINISEHPPALYHAALNLRAIHDLETLQLICEDEAAIRGLRECYLGALEDLALKSTYRKENHDPLCHALAFGTAFFHVSISAPSFDEFLDIIGIEDAFLPLTAEEMTPETARVAGHSSRLAEAFTRRYINLQLRRLGPQPAALTSTTLAAVVLWYAINGIPHSQEVMYGEQLRDSLASSELSWTGLGLLALMSDSETKAVTEDARKRKPYEIHELDRCRDMFMEIQTAYHLTQPNEKLSKSISKAINCEKNLETSAILFQATWKLFTKEIDGPGDDRVKWAQRALSTGGMLMCNIENEIQILSGKEKAVQLLIDKDKVTQLSVEQEKAVQLLIGKAKYHRTRIERLERFRSMCFKTMLDNMGPTGGELRSLKETAW